MPRESGPCRGSLSRFFFEAKSKECKEFIYGGCGGNENNFMQKSDCEKKCKKAEEAFIKENNEGII